MVLLEFGNEFYRTMVTAIDVGEDGGFSQLRIEPFRGDEVVNAPPGILFAGFEAIRPPGVDVGLVGVEVSEGVGEPFRKQEGHLGPFFVGKSGIASVGLGVLEVYFAVGYVEVAAEDDGFFPVEALQVVSEVVFPLHAIVQPAQFVLRIGYVGCYQVEGGIFQCDESAFVVVFVNAHSECGFQGLVTREDGCSGIAFLVGIVPE